MESNQEKLTMGNFKIWEYLDEKILNTFPDIHKEEENLSGYNHLWNIIYKIGTMSIYISSEYEFLSFYAINKNGLNLGIMNKHPDIFHDSFKTCKKNIDVIIDFLYKNRNEIFIEE